MIIMIIMHYFMPMIKKTFEVLRNSGIDLHHINKNGDTLLIYCCKNKKFINFYQIVFSTEDVNHVNNEGKTAAMYLVEEGRYEELKFLDRKKVNYNYKNKNNETLVTVLINKFKYIYDTHKFKLLSPYVYTMYVLIFRDCDFNIAIDEEGNTPIMYFLMIQDYYSTVFLLEKCKNLDLSIKNKNGISASSLVLSIHSLEQVLRQCLIYYETFDYDYVDSNNNSLVMNYIVRGNFDYDLKGIIARKKVSNEVNNRNENALIIATKFGVLRDYLFKNNDVNQQDYLGNTALFYAINLRDKEAINMLLYYKANPYIKNNEGISAADLANKTDDPSIIEIINNNPLPPEKMKKKVEREGKTLLIIDKKKTTDDKVNNYIKNYQIKNYKEEYKYMIENNQYTYSPLPPNEKKMVDDYLVNTYLYLYRAKAPNRMNNERIKKRVNVYIDDNEFLNGTIYLADVFGFEAINHKIKY